MDLYLMLHYSWKKTDKNKEFWWEEDAMIITVISSNLLLNLGAMNSMKSLPVNITNFRTCDLLSLEMHEQVNICFYIRSNMKDCFSGQKMNCPDLFRLLFFKYSVSVFFSNWNPFLFEWNCSIFCSSPHSPAETEESTLTELLPFGIC